MSTASEGALAPAPLQDGAEFMTAFATRELSDPAVAIVLAVAILSVYCLLRCTICRPKKENEEDLAAEWWRSSGGVSIPYEPEEHVVATMARWRGTALEMIFRKPMYYALIGSHVLLRYYDEYQVKLPPLDSTVLVGLPASLLIFLVVFYGGNCYNRYYELWGLLSEIVCLVYSWTLQVGFIYSPLEMSDDKLVEIGKGLDLESVRATHPSLPPAMHADPSCSHVARIAAHARRDVLAASHRRPRRDREELDRAG